MYSKIESLLPAGVLKGAVAALSMKIVGAVFGFLLNLLLARDLGAKGAGLFYLALSIVSALVIFSRFGIDINVIRYVAPFYSERKIEVVYQISLAALVLIVAFGTLISFVGYLSIELLSYGLFENKELVAPLSLMAFAALPMALVFLFSQLFRASNKTLISQFVLLVLPNGLFPILLFINAFWFGGGTIEEVALIYLIATSASMIFSVLLWFKPLVSYEASFANKHYSGVFRNSHHFFIGMVAEFSMAWLPIVLVGIHLPIESVGVFSVALRLSVLVSFIVAPVAVVIGPKIAIFYKEKDLDKARELLSKTNRFLFILSIPIVAFIILISPYLLSLFGGEFLMAQKAFIILAVGETVQMASGNSVLFLNMTSFEKNARDYRIAGVVTMVVLSALLIPNFGIVGASVAVVTGQLIKNILAFFFIKKEFGFWAI